jgi:ribonuclease R
MFRSNYHLEMAENNSKNRKKPSPSGKSGSRSGRKPGASPKASGKGSGKEQLSGVLSVNARGFGFVSVSTGSDIFIPLENMVNAMDGDTVLLEVLREVPKKNRVGRIIRVTSPSTKDIVGVFRKKDKRSIVVPDDERLKRFLEIPEDRINPVNGGKAPRNGELVLVRRESWDNPDISPSGQIMEVLGKPGDAGMDLKIVAVSKGLRTIFPEAVMAEVQKLAPPNVGKEKRKREDLRKLPCFTIDPEAAKDFDDAVSLRQLANGCFELGVHIADVSHYVREGSALDKEALERGTSVYFVDSVIPMLPEKISNDLCSLKEKENRFAFTVFMEIDSRGNVRDYRITESIIRSSKRFTYQEVEDIIQGKEHPYSQTIHLMMMLSLTLRRAREEMGSIDFDVPVPIISLDKNGIPYEVRPSERIDANRLVEEFMLVANLTVARHVKKTLPFIYRVHDKPDDEDVQSFLDLLGRLGIQYRVSGDLEPEDYRKILDIIENLDFKDFAEKVALRSMTKAVYSTENSGHFGLAFDAYTHFTSPIRRYPDLVVHRLLKKYLRENRDEAASKEEKKSLQSVCDHCTRREIRAVDAEREYTKIKAMEFLSGKIGESYNGVIAGITSFGCFVELTHYLIEGLVHVSEMKDDHYEFDKENYTLTGKSKGKVYRLGDPIRVTIKSVSVEERKADFVIAESKGEKA